MPITHATIDDRLLRLVACGVAKIDRDPGLLEQVRAAVARQPNLSIRAEWSALLELPWSTLRDRLLDPSDAGQALRQNAPLGSLLTPAERMAIFRAS